MKFTARFVLPLIVVSLVVGAAALNASSARATTLIKLTVEDMSRMADTIVVARTEAARPRAVFSAGPRSAVGYGVVTDVQLKVTRVLKGSAADRKRLVTPGGRIADLIVDIPGAPRFGKGETSILFLDGQDRVIGWSQGKLTVVGGWVPAVGQSYGAVVRRIIEAVREGRGKATKTTPLEAPATAALTASKPQTDGAPAATPTLPFREGFESGFGYWNTWSPGSTPTWGLTQHEVKSGSWSAYCAGSQLAAPGPYANNMQAWMWAGPFDLSDAANAVFEFNFYIDSEESYDWLYGFASTDDPASSSVPLLFSSSGEFASGWQYVRIDLATASGGPYLGDSSVWIGFIFESDGSATDEGAYVDDVRLTKNIATPVITGITPASASAGTNSAVTISGSGFGATQGIGWVAFPYQPPLQMLAPVVSWSNTQITCVVPKQAMEGSPGYPGAAGSGPVTVTNASGQTSRGRDFTVTFHYSGYKWPTPACTYVVNPNTTDTAGEEGMVDAAALTWNPASQFKYTDGGLSTKTADLATPDGTNVVFWSTTKLPAGVFAVTVPFTYVAFPDQLAEFDLCFNDTYVWGDGSAGTVDVQSVALHELGHALGLGDLYGIPDQIKAMFGFFDEGEVLRTLHAHDQQGVFYLYPDTTAPSTGDNAPAGWQKGAFTVTLSAADTGVGVASTHFRVNSGPWQTGTAAVVGLRRKGSPDGVNRVEYYSVDKAGNPESPKTCTVRIDTTAPYTANDAPAAPKAGPLVVHLSPWDAGCGVATTKYRLDGGGWQTGSSVALSAAGFHLIDYYSVDALGNTEVTRTCWATVL